MAHRTTNRPAINRNPVVFLQAGRLDFKPVSPRILTDELAGSMSRTGCPFPPNPVRRFEVYSRKGAFPYSGLNLRPSFLHSRLASLRPSMPQGGSPPPGLTHCPTISKPARPSMVLGNFLPKDTVVGNQPS